MTAAISVACHEGAQAVVCASTGNTSASMSAYAAKAGITPIVLIPEGKIAAGKMAQAIVHGAQIVMVRGNFDHCLQLARELSWRYPVALVNSVNPVRLQGQKTAAFEIVDFLGDAPDVHLLPVGNAGNIAAYWLGYEQYAALGRATRKPRMRGFQAEGAAPLVTGEPVPRPRDQGDRDPDRQPRLVEARRGGGRTSPAGGSARSATPRSWPRRPELARRDGVFVEPASAAGVAGLLADLAAGESYAGRTVVITVTGHGLKDTATALESAARPRRRRHRPRRRAGGGRRRARAEHAVTFVDGPVRVAVPATCANLGPGFDSPRTRARAARRARRPRSRPTVSGSRSPARAPVTSPRDETHLVVRAMRAAFEALGEQPAGLLLTCRNSIPHARGLGSSSAAIVGGRRTSPGPWSRAALGRCRTSRLPSGRRDRGSPRQRRACLLRRPHDRGAGRGRRRLRGLAAGGRRRTRGRVRATDSAVDLGRARPAAGRRSPSRRRRRRRTGRPAGRCADPRARSSPRGDPRTACTRTTAGRRCRSPSRSSTTCARTVCAAVVSGAGPTVLVLTTGSDLGPVTAYRPEGWRCHALEVSTTGVVATR